MRTIATIYLLLCFLLQPAFAFNYSDYKNIDIDDIISYRNQIKVGDRVIPNLDTIGFYAKLVEYPKKCDSAKLDHYLPDRYKSIQKLSLVIESQNGTKIQMYIQEVLGSYLEKEVEIGQIVYFFSTAVCISHDEPLGIIINEFELR